MSITMVMFKNLLPAKCLGYWVRVPLQPYLSLFLSFHAVQLLGTLKPHAQLCYAIILLGLDE